MGLRPNDELSTVDETLLSRCCALNRMLRCNRRPGVAASVVYGATSACRMLRVTARMSGALCIEVLQSMFKS